MIHGLLAKTQVERLQSEFMASIRIIFGSTSGHTEHVAEEVAAHVRRMKPKGIVTVQRAETAAAEDLVRDDHLVLAASTWNTGNVEGQLNPHMHQLLTDIARGVNLAGRLVGVIGLGDERYYYKCRAADLMEAFVLSHGGHVIQPVLRIINEPFGQEETVRAWAEHLLAQLD